MKLWTLYILIFVMMVTAMTMNAEAVKPLGLLKISSDSAVYNINENKMVFKGEVKTDDGVAKLACGEMEVFMDEKKQPKLINCNENVIIKREQFVSFSDHAEYSIKNEIVTLRGNAKVVYVDEKGQKSTTRGRVIIYDMKNGVVKVSDSKMDINGNK